MNVTNEIRVSEFVYDVMFINTITGVDMSAFIVMCKTLREQGVIPITNFFTFQSSHLMQHVSI